METERDALQHELVAELLLSIGWKSSNDAQWEGLRDALPKLAALASLAPAAEVPCASCTSPRACEYHGCKGAPAAVEGDAETEFEAFLKMLPRGAQQNVREAMDRSESVTFDAFKFGRELAAAQVVRKDAQRLRYCIERGRFPVKNVQRLPFPKLLGWTWDDLRPDPVYYPTADAAIDSAIAAGKAT